MPATFTYAARVVLLAGPTALAFFSGGYFDEPRAWGGLTAWLLVVVTVALRPSLLPRTRNAWLALAGLGLLAAWTLASIAWAPIAGSAYHAAQLVALYAGALLAATLLLRDYRAQRIVEPALAAGAVVVIGYGLSARLLPGMLHFARSISAQGRLEEPLTYWNATGELAALGLVLAARVAGDARRPVGVRALAAASAAPLGMGLYLSFSRGALLAGAAGLLVLLAAAPRREQFQALLLTAGAGMLAAVAAAPWSGVTSLAGPLATRERQGIVTLGLLVAIAGFAGLAQFALARRRHAPTLRLHPGIATLRPPRHALRIALLVSCAGLAAVITAAGIQEGAQQLAGVSRFATLASNRYDFWQVALRAFAHQPLRGVGAGGWQVWWLQYRPFAGFARDAHSLPLQIAAELGLVGVALLAAFCAGLVLAARRAHRVSPALAAGPVAGLVVYAIHAPLDWDWQMPAVTLPALVLGGALLGLGEAGGDGPRLHRPGFVDGTRRQKLCTARTNVVGDPAEEIPS